MIVKYPYYFPTDVPYPSVVYGTSAPDDLTVTQRMSSGRSRPVRKTLDNVLNADLTWSMSPEEYAVFKDFWDRRIHRGDDIFRIMLLDGRAAHEKVVQISGDTLSVTSANGRWSVSAPVQILVENPYLKIPILEVFLDIDSSSSLGVSPTRDNKSVIVPIHIPDGSGGFSGVIFDEMVISGSGWQKPAHPISTALNIEAPWRSNKAVVISINTVYDSSTSLGIVCTYYRNKLVTRQLPYSLADESSAHMIHTSHETIPE